MMKRLLVLLSACLVVSATAVLTTNAADEATPKIKDVMKALFKTKTAGLARVKSELNTQPTPWESIEKSAGEFVSLTAALGKNTPPKGDKASWEKLTLAVHENAKALDSAAKAKDKASAEAAVKKITGACQTCHAAHKGQ
jgi:hypothetical protein